MDITPNDFQREMIGILGGKVIAYLPALLPITGNVKTTLFLSQLIYWQGKGKNLWSFYKTVNQLQLETGLTKAEQLSAQKRCEHLGVLTVEYKGIPPRRYFEVDAQELTYLLSKEKSISDGRLSSDMDNPF